MASHRVLRFPRVDSSTDEADFVLVHVCPTKKASSLLDLKLIGTDGNKVYVTSIKHTQTASLKSKSTKSSQSDWESILGLVLLGVKADSALLEGVEVTSIVDDSKLKLNLRKRIGDITQRLGAIEFLQDDNAEEEFSGFDWCGLALESTSTSSHELEALKAKVKEQEEVNQKLEASLKDLLKAKSDHEDELLQKFAALLNEKKAKIRDQQRLLASANVDPRKLSAVEATRESRARKAGNSRAGKRKADHANTSKGDDESESMEVENEDRNPDPDQDEPMTSDKGSETETGSEDDDEKPKDATKLIRSSESISQTASILPDAMVVEDDDQPPPPRALPFNKKSTPAVQENVLHDESETQSEDDDEL